MYLPVRAIHRCPVSSREVYAELGDNGQRDVPQHPDSKRLRCPGVGKAPVRADETVAAKGAAAMTSKPRAATHLTPAEAPSRRGPTLVVLALILALVAGTPDGHKVGRPGEHQRRGGGPAPATRLRPGPPRCLAGRSGFATASASSTRVPAGVGPPSSAIAACRSTGPGSSWRARHEEPGAVDPDLQRGGTTTGRVPVQRQVGQECVRLPRVGVMSGSQAPASTSRDPPGSSSTTTLAAAAYQRPYISRSLTRTVTRCPPRLAGRRALQSNRSRTRDFSREKTALTAPEVPVGGK